MYIENIELKDKEPFPFGKQKRSIVYDKPADLKAILEEEMAGKYIVRMQGETGEQGEMLVMGENYCLLPSLAY